VTNSKNRRSPPDVPQPGPFLINGVQYYLAGRQAFRSGHNQDVSAFLFHLGFELMFKATVVSKLFRRYEPSWTADRSTAEREAADLEYADLTDKELRRIDHNLVVAWASFRQQHQESTLARFDSVVSALDRWRRLRYPGIALRDYYITSSHEDKVPVPSAVGPSGEPVIVYHVSLAEMDELFAATAPLGFTVATVRSAIEGAAGRPEVGMETYQWHNQHAIF
jgi:hypothetical protein